MTIRSFKGVVMAESLAIADIALHYPLRKNRQRLMAYVLKFNDKITAVTNFIY